MQDWRRHYQIWAERLGCASLFACHSGRKKKPHRRGCDCLICPTGPAGSTGATGAQVRQVLLVRRDRQVRQVRLVRQVQWDLWVQQVQVKDPRGPLGQRVPPAHKVHKVHKVWWDQRGLRARRDPLERTEAWVHRAQQGLREAMVLKDRQVPLVLQVLKEFKVKQAALVPQDPPARQGLLVGLPNTQNMFNSRKNLIIAWLREPPSLIW